VRQAIVEKDIVADAFGVDELEGEGVTDGAPRFTGEEGGRSVLAVAEQARGDEDLQFIDEVLGDEGADGLAAALDEDVGRGVMVGEVTEQRAEVERGLGSEAGQTDYLDAAGFEL
jgi:hypothetical protein